MNLLAGTYYDPGTAVSKATTALLAMTALDTTNLRLTFTAPPSGRVKVIISGGCIHGATTFPQILVGCLENSPSSGTVRGRQAPQGGGFNGTALATTQLPVRVEYIQVGLTPGQQYVWDAAYGVEIILASTGWKYGGPNNTTTNDAFGGISFEIWDPSPVYTAGSGIPPTTPISDRIDTIDNFVDTEITDIQARLPAALVSGRMDASVGAMAANVVTAASLAADAGAEIADAVWDEAIAGHLSAGSTGLALNSAGAGGDPWATALPGAYAAGTAGNIVGNRLDAAVTSRMASYTQPTGFLASTFPATFNNLSAAQVNAEVDTAIADAALATAANLAAVQTSVDDLPTNAELATALATADDAILAQVALVKAKTDSLTFTVAGELDANIQSINDVTITGNGQTGTEFGV